MITYVIPTHNRPAVLAETLDTILRLGPHEAEVLIVDNSSNPSTAAPARLSSGVPCRVVRLGANIGAAARNVAITHADASSRWLVMLDDDSAPMDLGFLAALREARADDLIVAAEIFLPTPPGAAVRHESGGLPEVFVGCGAAIRADFFRAERGYDATFDYYAEEYDLSARALLTGGRVVFDRRFRVMHRKVTQGRDFGRVVSRLVRNNAWVSLRYAPDDARASATIGHITRYGVIARKERALAGYARGVAELARTWRAQPRRTMPDALWDRFTGLAAARQAVELMINEHRPREVALIAPGKHVQYVAQALSERGIEIASDSRSTHGALGTQRADVLFVATLSPGPMLDAAAAFGAVLGPASGGAPVVMPWLMPAGGCAEGRQRRACASAA